MLDKQRLAAILAMKNRLGQTGQSMVPKNLGAVPPSPQPPKPLPATINPMPSPMGMGQPPMNAMPGNGSAPAQKPFKFGKLKKTIGF